MNLWGWIIGEQRRGRAPVGRQECGSYSGDDPLGDVQEEGGVCRGTPWGWGGVMGTGVGEGEGAEGWGSGVWRSLGEEWEEREGQGDGGGRRQGQDCRKWLLAWAAVTNPGKWLPNIRADLLSGESLFTQ